MSKKGIPGEKFEYKQAAKCRIQHRSMLKAWSGCIPLSGNSQKKTAQLHANSWGEQALCITLHTPPLVEFDGPRQGGQADAVNLRKALGLCDQRFQQQTTEAHAAMFLCHVQMWH